MNCHCLPTPPSVFILFRFIQCAPRRRKTNTRTTWIYLKGETDRPTHFSFLTVSFYGGVGVIVRLGFTRRRRKNWFLRVEEYIFRTPLSPPVSLLTPTKKNPPLDTIRPLLLHLLLLNFLLKMLSCDVARTKEKEKTGM